MYIAIAFFMAYLTMLGEGGYFDSNTATVSSLRQLNSPNGIVGFIGGFTTLLYFFLPAIFGTAINKDFETQTHQVLYAYPFSKFQYLLGKFLSALVIALIVYAFVGIGIFAATLTPGMNADLLAENQLLPYVKAYGLYIIPNLVIFGGLVFVLVSVTRNITLGYVLIIFLLFQDGIIGSLFSDMEDKSIGALLDPFGFKANDYYTEYWTIDEYNNNPSPIGKYLWLNRLLWLALGTLFLSLFYKKFELSQSPVSWFGRKSKASSVAPKQSFGKLAKIQLPAVSLESTWWNNLKNIWFFSNMHLRYIVKSTAFLVFSLLGLVFMLIIQSQSGKILQTETYPLTENMLQAGIFFSIFLFILTFLFSGFLLHREKDSNMHQLVDTTLASNSTHLWAKFLAILKMQFVTLGLVMISGIGFQIYKGYYNFEIGHYLFDLFGTSFFFFIPYIGLAFLVHKLIPNKYVGFIILLVLFFAIPQLSRIGIEQPIFKFNSGRFFRTSYSALDGYGHRLTSFYAFSFYWILCSLVFLFTSLLLWRRGFTFSMKERLAKMGQRFKAGVAMPLMLSLIAFLSMGFWIYQESNVKDKYWSSKEREQSDVDWEKLYKPYEHTPKPRITAIDVALDLRPEDRTFQAKGKYQLLNKSSKVVDSLIINYNDHPQEFSFDKATTLLKKDTVFNISLYQLETPLLPGDSLAMTFTIKNKPNTFFRNHSGLFKNGTFVNNKSIFPSIGYDSRYELTDDDVREEYGLLPKERKKPPTDTIAIQNNDLSNDSDWVDFEITISTAPNQLAIAPGYLQKEWEANGRKYYHYKMDAPILNFYSITSGEYEVRRDKWKDVSLEIYHHKDHTYNLDRMMKGLKRGLDYYTENFSPYQHRQVRIIEFPRHQGSFAQSFANTIPFSEGFGFTAKVDDSEEGSFDYPFAVTAHELAHQWWGHQVVGANVQGSTMIIESLSEYSALKVLEKEYGKSKMRKFLKNALDKYLQGRTREQKKENPLMYCEDQEYIRYDKGSLVMYAMSDYLGDTTLNNVLKNYIAKTAFQEAPYTTTLELVGMIDDATPDSLKYLIKDMFETITLYSNRVMETSAEKMEDGRYKVTLDYQVRKYRANDKGKRIYSDIDGEDFYQLNTQQDTIRSLPLQDYIEIGVFGEEDKELYLQKHKITKIFDTVELILDEEPKEVGIDPYNKLIDTQSEDNRRKVKVKN